MVLLSSSFGGRVELVSVSSEGFSAVYEGHFWEGERGFQATVTVTAAGSVEYSEWRAESAPGWLIELSRSLLRTAWRQRATGTPWPRRVTRWRKGSNEG